MKFEITNVEVIGEDGQYVFVSFNTGDTAVLPIDNIKVKEFQNAGN